MLFHKCHFYKKNWEMWQEGNGKDIFDVLCLNYEGNNQVK